MHIGKRGISCGLPNTGRLDGCGVVAEGCGSVSFAVGIFPGNWSMGSWPPFVRVVGFSTARRTEGQLQVAVVVVIVCFSTRGSGKLSSWWFARG